jgi:hypothetical protein
MVWKNSLEGGTAHRKASTYTRQRNTQNRGHTSMPRAVFEPTIPVFDRSATGADDYGSRPTVLSIT